MRLNDGPWPYNPCIIREGKKRRTRIAWPWASSLIPVCRVRNVPRGDTRWMCVYTRSVRGHARGKSELGERAREREEERDRRRNKKEKERERVKKKKGKKRNKRDANSLLHREHGHDVKAKEGMRYIRAIRSPRLLNVNALGRFLEFRRKIDDP